MSSGRCYRYKSDYTGCPHSYVTPVKWCQAHRNSQSNPKSCKCEIDVRSAKAEDGKCGWCKREEQEEKSSIPKEPALLRPTAPRDAPNDVTSHINVDVRSKMSGNLQGSLSSTRNPSSAPRRTIGSYNPQPQQAGVFAGNQAPRNTNEQPHDTGDSSFLENPIDFDRDQLDDISVGANRELIFPSPTKARAFYQTYLAQPRVDPIQPRPSGPGEPSRLGPNETHPSRYTGNQVEHRWYQERHEMPLDVCRDYLDQSERSRPNRPLTEEISSSREAYILVDLLTVSQSFPLFKSCSILPLAFVQRVLILGA